LPLFARPGDRHSTAQRQRVSERARHTTTHTDTHTNTIHNSVNGVCIGRGSVTVRLTVPVPLLPFSQAASPLQPTSRRHTEDCPRTERKQRAWQQQQETRTRHQALRHQRHSSSSSSNIILLPTNLPSPRRAAPSLSPLLLPNNPVQCCALLLLPPPAHIHPRLNYALPPRNSSNSSNSGPQASSRHNGHHRPVPSPRHFHPSMHIKLLLFTLASRPLLLLHHPLSPPLSRNTHASLPFPPPPRRRAQRQRP
jgi:hypothetical protein